VQDSKAKKAKADGENERSRRCCRPTERSRRCWRPRRRRKRRRGRLGKYFDDPYNTSDCLIVGFSVLEFCLVMRIPSYGTGGGSDFTGPRVLAAG
jgi:hypothetical protein